MKRILCIMHLPPPLHGASQSNYNLAKSNLINSHYKLQIINLQFSSSLTDLRKFSFLKIWKALKYAVIICYEISNFKPDLVYLTLSPNGFAFYRDAFYTFIVKLFRVKILFHLHGKGIKKAVEKSTFRKSIYGTFIFAPVALLLTSCFGIYNRKRVDYVFNSGLVSFIILFLITIIYLMIHT